MISAWKASRENHSLNKYVVPEKPAHHTQCEKMLKAFNERGWVSTAYLRSFAYQYNARIKELRDGLYDGRNHTIVAEKKMDLHGFRYVGYSDR